MDNLARTCPVYRKKLASQTQLPAMNGFYMATHVTRFFELLVTNRAGKISELAMHCFNMSVQRRSSGKTFVTFDAVKVFDLFVHFFHMSDHVVSHRKFFRAHFTGELFMPIMEAVDVIFHAIFVWKCLLTNRTIVRRDVVVVRKSTSVALSRLLVDTEDICRLLFHLDDNWVVRINLDSAHFPRKRSFALEK